MTLKDAKKVLDGVKWLPGTSTRGLSAEERAEVKSALNLYASAGESYSAHTVKAQPKKTKSEG